MFSFLKKWLKYLFIIITAFYIQPESSQSGKKRKNSIHLFDLYFHLFWWVLLPIIRRYFHKWHFCAQKTIGRKSHWILLHENSWFDSNFQFFRCQILKFKHGIVFIIENFEKRLKSMAISHSLDFLFTIDLDLSTHHQFSWL